MGKHSGDVTLPFSVCLSSKWESTLKGKTLLIAPNYRPYLRLISVEDVRYSHSHITGFHIELFFFFPSL